MLIDCGYNESLILSLSIGWKFIVWAIVVNLFMMTWHGNVFHITGPFRWKSTGHWWIPLIKGQWCGALMFSLLPGQAIEPTIELPVIWDILTSFNLHRLLIFQVLLFVGPSAGLVSMTSCLVKKKKNFFLEWHMVSDARCGRHISRCWYLIAPHYLWVYLSDMIMMLIFTHLENSTDIAFVAIYRIREPFHKWFIGLW